MKKIILIIIKMDKIKNKKKDIIESESTMHLKSEIKKEEEKKEEKNIKILELKKKDINISDINTQIINKLILLLSLNDKIDIKLVNILSNYLSQNHLKEILEERDCRNICGNLICGEELLDDINYKKYFDPNEGEITKLSTIDSFCDEKCFEIFNNIYKFSSKYDYSIYLNIESIYLFKYLKDYLPVNKYLNEISELAEMIISSIDENNLEKNEIYKKKYDNYFLN